MKKRGMSLLLAFCMLMSMFTALPITASAATSGQCGDNVYWTLDDNGTLTISGTGAMWNYTYSRSAPWNSERNSIKTVIIQNGITSISEYAFFDCIRLTSINIPNSVTSIGDSTFHSCTSLTSVTIPDSVTSIRDRSFYNCSSLTSVTIPDSVTSIGYATFYGCSSLTSVNIPNSVTSINSSAFFDCTSLTSVTIPGSVTSIGGYAFFECRSLKDVYYSGSAEQWNNIDIGTGNADLTGAAIHYNSKPRTVDKNKYNSSSTTGNAPVIKSAVVKSGIKSIDILKTSLNIDKNKDNKLYDIKLDIDWKGTAASNRAVYLTQGITDSKSAFIKYNSLTDSIENINLGALFEAGKPVYIIAVDKSSKELRSSTITTKLNIIGKKTDEVFETSKKGKFDFKLGKDIKFTIPEEAPILGGTELSWKLDFIPVTVAYSDNDTMSIAIGVENLVTEEKNGTIKFKNFNFARYKSAIDDYNNLSKKYNKSTRTLEQLRNDTRMKQAKKLKKPLSMSMWDGKVLKSTGKGDSDFGIDCTGYAEIKRDKNGNWDYKNVHGYVDFEIKISYTYEGQVFIYTIPCYYTIGGELGAGLEANIYKFDLKNFRPVFSGTNQEKDDTDPTGLYFNSDVTLRLGAGVGVPHVATFGATGEGSLNLKMGLSEEVSEYMRVFLTAKAGYELVFLGKKLASKDDIVSLDKNKGVIYSTFPNDKDKSWIKSKTASLMSMNDLYSGYSAENVYGTENRGYQSDTNWYAEEPQLALMSADYSNKDLRLLADNIYPNAQPQITDINGTKVLIYTADNTERTAENRQMLVYTVYNEEAGTWSSPTPVCDDGTADFYPGISGEYIV